MASASVKIDLHLCNSCRTCVDACFIDVLRWDDKEQKPIVAYPGDCVWCCACQDACPVQCIDIIPVLPWRVPAAL